MHGRVNRGGKLYEDGGKQSGFNCVCGKKFFGPKRDAFARGELHIRKFCEKTKDYPTDVLNKMLKEFKDDFFQPRYVSC